MEHVIVKEIQSILKSYDIECWMMYSDEGSDIYLSKYITKNVISATVCIITQHDCFLIANELDFDNLLNYQNIQNVKYNNSDGYRLFDNLFNVLKKLKFPSCISFSFTTIQDTLVDVIGHGTFIYVTDKIKKFYGEQDKQIQFASAEKAVYGLCDRKNEDAVNKLKVAAERADDILSEAFQKIKIGMSEKDVAHIVHEIFQNKPDYFSEKKIVREEFSWDKEFCPVVLAGPSFTKGGHAIASDLIIEAGYTIYFDFGVKHFFEDGSYYSSDIQRMGYVLRGDEEEAPKDIADMFNTLYESITLGIKNLVSGKKGFEIDKIVRGYIKDRGYKDYDHSTGHAIGEIAHSPGTLLGSESNGLSQLEIQPNGVYTIEPRIPIVNGGSIEEMVLATEKGGISISPRQTKLHLIKSN